MKKSSTTKRALLASVLATLMCCAMLVGSTFAWFTDVVTSGPNKIVAGNLDVELEYWNDTLETPDWVEVTNETENLFEGVVWEPGVVVTRKFKVTNAGSLALNYKVFLTADANEVNGHSLDEVITIGCLTEAPADRETAAAAATASFKEFAFAGNAALLSEESEEFILVLAWNPTNHDDDYNMNNENKGEELYIDVKVNLSASQAMYEADSFGNDYDSMMSNAILKVTETIKQGAKDSNAAIIEGIKEIAGENVPENIDKLVYFDEDLVLNEAGELATTLHFAEGSSQYVAVTYTAVKALIGKAINEQASNIKSIKIALAEERVLNGEPFADDSGDWVEEDLKTTMNGIDNRTLQGALEAAQEYGLDVTFTDMDGNVQVYRMNFDIDANW